MANIEAKCKVKLQILDLTNKKTKVIIDTGNLDKIKRHKETLESLVKTVEYLKIEVEENYQREPQ
jgi:hypothetical protein